MGGSRAVIISEFNCCLHLQTQKWGWSWHIPLPPTVCDAPPAAAQVASRMLQTQVWGVESIKLTISFLLQGKAVLPWTSHIPIKISAPMSLVRGAGDSLGSAECVGEIQVLQHPDCVWHQRWLTSYVPASLTHISVCPGLEVRPPKCNPAKGAMWGFIPWPPLRQEQHSSQCGPWICLDLWSIHYFNSTHWLRVKNLFPVFFLFKERARMSQSHASSNWVSVSFVLETEK